MSDTFIAGAPIQDADKFNANLKRWFRSKCGRYVGEVDMSCGGLETVLPEVKLRNISKIFDFPDHVMDEYLALEWCKEKIMGLIDGETRYFVRVYPRVDLYRDDWYDKNGEFVKTGDSHWMLLTRIYVIEGSAETK